MSKQVAATLVADIDIEGLAPGSFEYYAAQGKPDAGMIYVCPCGCGRLGSLQFKPAPSPSWSWDGNREKPTLAPSIHDMPGGKTHWHGHLRNGVFEEC